MTGVSAVVVNHDGGAQILRCLRYLEAQCPALEELIVVDSGSTDGSPDAIRRAFPAVRVVELGGNLGPSVARNCGLQQSKMPFVLFVDDDVYLAPDCTRLLMERLLATGAAVAVPRLLLYPETDLIQLDGGEVHFLGTMVLRNARAKPASVPSGACPIGTFSTSCLLADRATMLDAGGMDEAFFIYLEDMELGLRLRSLGHRLVVEPAAIAHHDRGAGTPDLSYRDHGTYPKRRAFLTMRNRLQVIFLHYRGRTLLMLAPALALYELATLAFVIRRGWFGVWFAAWWWQVTHIGDLTRRRREIQTRRRCSDGELLVGGSLSPALGVLRSSTELRVVAALTAVLDRYWRMVRRALGWHPPGHATSSGTDGTSEAFEYAKRYGSCPDGSSAPEGGRRS